MGSPNQSEVRNERVWGDILSLFGGVLPPEGDSRTAELGGG